MRNRSIMFALLLATGLVSGTMLWWNHSLQENFPDKPRVSSHEETVAPGFWKKQKVPAGKASQPTVVYKTNQFRWSQIESTDYREYIANLRKVGCPEPTIRDIIITDIMRLYAARRGQFYHNGREFKFWETDEKRKLKAKQLEEREKQLASIDKEIPTVLRELLGINYERELNKYFVDTDDDNRRLSFLSQEKRDSLIALRDEIEGMREKITENAKGRKLTPDEWAQLKKIDALRQEKLSHLLSGPELDQFELSTSETADRLRKDLTGFNPSEEEFRDMFKLFKEHDAKYASADVTDPQIQQEMADDQERIEAEILSRLSPARAQDYARTKNEEFRNLSVFTEIYELPPSTTQSLFDIQQAVKEEKEKLLSAGLSPEAQVQGLRAIQQETEKTVTRLIGSQLYGKFTQSTGSWIPNLVPN